MTRTEPRIPNKKDAALVLADGSVFFGQSIGKFSNIVGEICFTTGMTGYQETLTDPSFCDQIVTFTFPHIGNVGTNDEDMEADRVYAAGLIIRTPITSPSNFRNQAPLNEWLKDKGVSGICSVDTRAITRHIREKGAQNAGILKKESGSIEIEDIKKFLKQIRKHPPMEGLELAKKVSCKKPYGWNEPVWSLDKESTNEKASTVCVSESSVCLSAEAKKSEQEVENHIIAIDYGAKYNILRSLVSSGCKVTVVPADTSAENILSYNPDGVFLSNGPGDPAATGKYAIPVIKKLVESGLPLFGICLGHQLLSLALGCETEKMHRGHRGANQPVQRMSDGVVEITSQNHGFVVKSDSLPDCVIESHTSLFDGTLEGIELEGKPVFSVQHHPEASPGPHDSAYLFDQFVEIIKKYKASRKAA